MKVCTRCEQARDASMFWKQARRQDGLSSECKVCQSARNKAHYEANREQEKARAQEWRKANPDKVAASGAAWRADNHAHHLATKVAYRANNQEKVQAARRSAYQANKEAENASARAYKRTHKEALALKAAERLKANPQRNRMQRVKRRAQERIATPAWANRFFMAEAYRLARMRTAMLGQAWHVDHIVPLLSPIVCGLNCETNLRVVPMPVNATKSNTYWPDMPT